MWKVYAIEVMYKHGYTRKDKIRYNDFKSFNFILLLLFFFLHNMEVKKMLLKYIALECLRIFKYQAFSTKVFLLTQIICLFYSMFLAINAVLKYL